MINRLQFPYLCQRDEKWSKVKIGNSQVDLGHYGCLITCISMASHLFGEYKTPDQIAKQANLFSDDGSLLWINLNKLFKKFDFRWREGNILVNSDTVDKDLINAYLPGGPRAKDGVVIFSVAKNSHWILPLWYNEYEKDYVCVDPWTGQDCYALKRYGSISTHAHLLKAGVAKNRLEPEAPEYK